MHSGTRLSLCVALLLTVVFVALAPESTLGQQTIPPQEQAQAAVKQFLDTAGDVGFAIAVWQDSEIVWSEQWGERDKQQKLPVTSETMFRIGSVTKVMTATAAAAMAEHNKFDLDKPIKQYLPDIPAHLAPITPRQIAGHLSGIRHYDPERIQQEILIADHFDNQAAALKLFASDPLVHDPGDAYFYSTHAFTVLGAALESASEQSMAEVLRERILKPAEMRHTFAEHNEEFSGELAVPYAIYQGQEIIVPHVDNSWKLAGGGLISTPVDLAKFLGAVADNRLVSAETLAMMLQAQSTNAGQKTGVGLGWRIAKDSSGRTLIHHGGSAAGGRAFVLLYPKERIGVAACMNLAADEVRFDEELMLKVLSPYLAESK